GTKKCDLVSFHSTPSRYRNLRVHLFPDSGLTNDRPDITAVKVRRTVKVPGEDVTLPANLGERQGERGDGGAGSAWMIDFGGEKAPCKKLTFDIADPEFQRNYRLEIPGTEDEESVFRTNRYLTSGSWERRADDRSKPMEIELPSEVMKRRLRLVVTDNRNDPLDIKGVRYTAPVRQVIFATAELAPPLRLYFGNPKAVRPQYDFEALLPPNLEPPPLRVTLGPVQANPNYQPPPKPLTEAWPWLAYAVLGLASLVLLGILAGLGREAIARHDQRIAQPAEPAA